MKIYLQKTFLNPVREWFKALFVPMVVFLIGLNAGNLYGFEPAELTVSGTITDARSGASLPGVYVVIKGTTVGTTSDVDGKYVLKVSNGNSELVFSFVGYQSKTVAVNNRSTIDVALTEDVRGIEDVVVVGYGVQKKSDLTGVISSIKAADIQKMAVSSVDQALQGKASGVYVTRKSGAPGDGAKIFVRGQGSINNTDPIWVIDGVKSSSGANFNMNNIESIEILKDASAAAIYGVEAANGVILVTTKRGTKGEPKVAVNAYYGQNSPVNMPDMLNTQEFAKIKNQARDDAGKSRIPRIADMDNLPSTSTDWFDEIFSPAPSKNIDLSVSGGTDKMNFYVSGNYYDETGTMVNTGYKRITLTANSDFIINKSLKIGESMTFTTSDNKSFYNPEDPYKKNNLLDFVRAIPTMPAYDATNEYGGFGYADPVVDEYQGENPFAAIMQNEFNSKNHEIKANAYLDWEIVKDLHFRTTVGGNFNLTKNDLYRAPYFYGTHLFDPAAEIRNSFRENYELLANAVLTYTKSFGEHNITAMAGAESQKTDWTYFWARGKDFAGGLTVLDAGKQDNRDNGGNEGLDRVLSQFGRFNYSYAGKYLFTANIRRDGSSKFGALSRWGVFPSFSAGWNVHKESFLASVDQISYLKVTLGYGKLGSDRIPSFLGNEVYMTSPLYYVVGNPETLVEGAAIARFPNKQAKWEEIAQFDAGFNLGLFDNKLEFTSNYYLKKTSDMLIAVSLPPSAGFTYGYDGGDESDLSSDPSINIGEIKNQGIEFAVTHRNKIGDFSYTVSGNLSYNENQVIQLNENQVIASGDMTLLGSSKVSRIEAGYPIAYYYGYQDEGIFQSQDELNALNSAAAQKAYDAELANNPNTTKTIKDFASVYYQYKGTAPGDYRWKDIAGRDANKEIVNTPDGRITDADKAMIGNPWPKWIYGVNVSMNWKDFDFSFFGQGVQGRDVYNSFRYYLENVAGDGNYGTSILNAWTPDNTNTNVPRVTLSDPNKNAATVSTRYIEDGSYFRIKNIQLGYTLPSKVAGKMNVSKFRVYLTGQNLLTFTNYSGIDPEFSVGEEKDNTSVGIDRGYYPQNKTYLVGVQIEF